MDAATTPPPIPPKRWLAVLLTFLMAGLGHVYVGRVWRGAGFQLAAQALVAILHGVFLASPMRFWTAFVIGGVGAAAFLGAMVFDVARLARRPRAALRGRWAVLLACVGFFAIGSIVDEAIGAARKEGFGDAFRIPSEGMAPTLVVGDHLYTDAMLYRRRNPQRGEVVIFTVARDGAAIYPADRRPELSREALVKRIVAMPGDTVEVAQGTLHLNGQAVPQEDLGESFTTTSGRQLLMRREILGERSYMVLDDPTAAGLQQSRFIVEPGRYFVMGDNRDHSNDSRNWGTVRREEILGPVGKLYWSWSYTGPLIWNPLRLLQVVRQHTRWDRIDLEVH